MSIAFSKSGSTVLSHCSVRACTNGSGSSRSICSPIFFDPGNADHEIDFVGGLLAAAT